jgi:hypothetical protein
MGNDDPAITRRPTCGLPEFPEHLRAIPMLDSANRAKAWLAQGSSAARPGSRASKTPPSIAGTRWRLTWRFDWRQRPSSWRWGWRSQSPVEMRASGSSVPAFIRSSRGARPACSQSIPRALDRFGHAEREKPRHTLVLLYCFQNRSISTNVNDADQAISTKPVSASVPVMNRTAPTGTTSPKPSVVKQTAE